MGYTLTNTATLTLDGVRVESLTITASSGLTLNIVTNSDSYIGSISLKSVNYEIGTYHTVLSGSGKLTVRDGFPQGGGNNVAITVAAGADVVVGTGFTFGASGSNYSTLTVNGTLTVDGYITCGTAEIGAGGTLTCHYLGLAGYGDDSDNDIKDAFVMARAREIYFTGGSSFAALYVNIGGASPAPDPAEVIVLPGGTLPSGFLLDNVEVEKGGDFATIMKVGSMDAVSLGGNGEDEEGVASASDLGPFIAPYQAKVDNSSIRLCEDAAGSGSFPLSDGGTEYYIKANTPTRAAAPTPSKCLTATSQSRRPLKVSGGISVIAIAQKITPAPLGLSPTWRLPRGITTASTSAWRTASWSATATTSSSPTAAQHAP